MKWSKVSYFGERTGTFCFKYCPKHLAARSVGRGVGWVSILDPIRLTHELNLSEDWTLVGYLCVGWPEEDNDTPELERYGWEKWTPRTSVDDMNITSV